MGEGHKVLVTEDEDDFAPGKIPGLDGLDQELGQGSPDNPIAISACTAPSKVFLRTLARCSETWLVSLPIRILLAAITEEEPLEILACTVFSFTYVLVLVCSK